VKEKEAAEKMKGEKDKKGSKKDIDNGEPLLGKRDDVESDDDYDAEYAIIQQRMDKINQRASLMEGVFEKMRAREEEVRNEEGESGGEDNFDDFLKGYKRKERFDPLTNDKPLF